MGEFLGDTKRNKLCEVEQTLRGALAAIETLQLHNILETLPGATYTGAEYNKPNAVPFRMKSKDEKIKQIRTVIQNKFNKKYPLA